MSSIESVTELCSALVRIPSENPSGAPESAGEEAIGRFTGEFLSAHGASVEFEYVAEGRPNVYGWFPRPPAAKTTILFAPHLDTVPTRGMTIDPFKGDIVDGRLLGRGATDTKGPMAAMLWALTTTDLSKLNVAVGFVGLADEEADQLGSKVCARRREADFVVVGGIIVTIVAFASIVMVMIAICLPMNAILTFASVASIVMVTIVMVMMIA